MARQKGTDFDNINTNGNKRDKVKVTDVVTLFKFPEKKWVTLRLYGDIHSYATAWVKTKTKDGKSTKFPIDLPSYDPTTQTFDSTKYDPWYEFSQQERDNNVERDDQMIQVGRKFYMNALLRHLQKQQPSTKIRPTSTEKETGFKDKDSDTWTPWQVLALSPGLIGKIRELKGLNTVTSKKTGATKTYNVSDEKFGRDIRILYDSTKSPGDQYQVVPGDSRTPMTEEELSFLRWDTSALASEPPSDEETKKEFESWAKRNGIKLKSGKRRDEEDIDEDEDESPKKGKSKKTTTSKKKQVEEDDEDDEDLDGDDDGLDEDEDDEPAPKKGKKAPAKGKKVVEEDDDDDLDEDEDEDEDEDDEPAPKKGKKAAPAKGKKKQVDEDDEDEDDEDLDDDEDDEPAPKKGKAVKGKKKPVEEDDEDEDDDDLDEDEDEDDEPAPKKSKKAAPKGKKKPVEDDEDEDEDEDLDDDEDDEDEEPAPKKSKKPAAKKVAKKTSKKKPVEEDEDDEDDLDD
ncbi:hypothetical protein BcepSauron_242 [Burkholderia phage BcepSauron]|uniref:Uncharacterized protein n=1 Tax=Burkholderia phage BcepSauron TaxID=2530033 RepID=A0A482MMX0_9CAUD|nr:single strand DNA binding protein [Burkholderia phage BcepSauron]QBQ74622.1 hypothetical protein BcepSauron_242 [Burkholderia phage BcepSauron]